MAFFSRILRAKLTAIHYGGGGHVCKEQQSTQQRIQSIGLALVSDLMARVGMQM